jgi:CubicO group peptidase (beta-lactamase class C family)
MKGMAQILIVLLYLINYAYADAQNHKEKIDSLITAYYNADCFNGVVLVSEKGKVILKKAYGIADRELDVPMTTEMRFRIASISKPFTAFIILQLVNEGIIRMDGKITDYIPDYKGEKGDSITIEYLLTHTSGILQNLEPEEETIQERLYHKPEDLVKYIEESNLYFEPGTGFHYSNLAYSLLSYIAERVTNISFDKLLTDRIFEPLGMTNTNQCNSTKIEKNLAKGYEYKLLSGYENASYVDPSYTIGAGGLISNVDDLSKFDKALYCRQFISTVLYNKMFEPSKHGSYGYGWELGYKITGSQQDTTQIISHAGSINGFGSYMARIESDSILVIVLKNSRTDNYISPAYAPFIGQEIIAILYDEDVQIPKNSIAKRIGLLIGQNGIEQAIEEYYRLKSSEFEYFNFEESELNKLGIELFFKFNRPEDALKVFKINMLEFPHSYNTYDSYAYVLMKTGDYINSIKYYREGIRILKEYPQINNSNSTLKDAENASKSIKEMEMKIKAGLAENRL